MFLSVLQLVLAPVLAGTALNQFLPNAVARVKLYTPFMATVVVFLIVGSMIATNQVGWWAMACMGGGPEAGTRT